MPLSGEARARGRDRMKELVAEYKSEIATNVEIVIATLGREPTELERMQAEILCALFLKARRLRDRGRDDVHVLREAALMMRDVPWLRGPVPTAQVS